jgi:SNF2 family DNA or RNA helicase
LGKEVFPIYLSCIEGCRFTDDKKNVTTIAKAIPMVAKLKEARFVVKGSKDLIASFRAFAAGTAGDVREASERAIQMDAELRSRGLSLFPFQKTGIEWLAAQYGALLADSPGLGKTAQALLAAPYPAPLLIVCPSSAKPVWDREIPIWRPDFRPVTLAGRESFRWPRVGEAVIINYDILPEFVYEDTDDGEELQPALPASVELLVPQGTILVADEAHYLKNYQSNRTQQFNALSSLVRKNNGRVWLLTATPLLNFPPELWTVFSAAGIATEAFGSYKKFVSLFGGVKTEHGHAWSDPKPEVADRIRRVCLRRKREEVLPELPVKMWREILVDVDSVTKELCDEAVASLLAQGIDLYGADDSLAKIGQLNVPEIGAISRARSALAKLKMPVLLSLLAEYEAQEEPVVVFSAHRAPVDYFAERSGWKTIVGGLKTEIRKSIEDDFQDGRLLGVAATIQAGGVSITLTRAAHLIFVDRMFQPALNEQAEDRICRIGQKRGCLITILVAKHPLDKRLHEILVRKQSMVTKSVDAARQKPVVVDGSGDGESNGSMESDHPRR